MPVGFAGRLYKMIVEESVVESALEKLRPSLVTDGFDLKASKRSDDGTVEVILEAKPAACLDCLVPDEVIVQILEDAIRQQDSSLSGVVLVKRGFENIAAH
jgi:Fe-S cluster biogenesis protein NfuA